MDTKRITCRSCPVQCQIAEGRTGACKRFINIDGVLERNRDIVYENPKNPIWERARAEQRRLKTPVLTGVGAGSTYPCMRPAPIIASEVRDGIEVVTAVTEAPLSYSGVKVKVDTNTFLGHPGEKIYCRDSLVGMVETEEYGSKMLSIGGAEIFTSGGGMVAAQTVVALANGEKAELVIGEHHVSVQAGFPPVIDGKQEKRMRFGCGSATIGIFAPKMKQAADEVIVIDHHIIGLLTEHIAGEEVGLEYLGVQINGKRSSRGRYFGTPGDGIMGTSFKCPIDVVKGVDRELAFPGMTLLVTDTIGETKEMFCLNDEFDFYEIPLTEAARQLTNEIAENCEKSTVSVLYVGGSGGSARGGVTKCPIELTKAVHSGEAILTIGGAPAYVYPGGGINFIVDTEQVVEKAFTWVPTPATVAPIEYTMTRKNYEKIGGHTQNIIKIKSEKREKAND